MRMRTERPTFIDEGKVKNWQTRVNYGPGARALMLGAVVLPTAFAAKVIESVPNSMPPGMEGLRGHLFDMFAIPAFSCLYSLIGASVCQSLVLGTTQAAILENLQRIEALKETVFGGTYDKTDFLAYGLGLATMVAFEASARVLHDTGATLPIYRILNIEHNIYG